MTCGRHSPEVIDQTRQRSQERLESTAVRDVSGRASIFLKEMIYQYTSPEIIVLRSIQLEGLSKRGFVTLYLRRALKVLSIIRRCLLVLRLWSTLIAISNAIVVSLWRVLHSWLAIIVAVGCSTMLRCRHC